MAWVGRQLSGACRQAQANGSTPGGSVTSPGPDVGNRRRIVPDGVDAVDTHALLQIRDQRSAEPAVQAALE